MGTVVMDTNLVSYRMKKHPLAKRYDQLLKKQKLAVSFMTVAEMYEGAYRASWGVNKMGNLESALGSYAVIESSPAICRRWGELRSERRHRPIATDDAWIAATALANGWPLATHNARDFEGISGLKLITVPE
ncbi:MAG: PIN domain-containing protein [Deltaproteobacteria bacterium]|nr:PIN domain-containing protein [Deltaproteobacteria bacterium]